MKQHRKDYLISLGLGLFISILLDQLEMIEGMFQQTMICLTTAILLLVGDMNSRTFGGTKQ